VLSPSDVSCVIPTRGNVDLTQILETLPFDDIIVWDNSLRDDEGLYGRYAAIEDAKNDVIVTQDDDVLVTCWDQLLAAYEPGVLTVNYPEPWDIPWVACGGLFDRELPTRAFDHYFECYPDDDMFRRQVCDAVFCLLTPSVKVLDLGYEDLPHGLHDGRISTTPGWYTGPRAEAQRRCRQLLEVAA
jgi:hypothetical protein